MKLKTAAIVLVFSLGMMVLAGCGGGGPQPTDENNPSTQIMEQNGAGAQQSGPALGGGE